MSVSAALIVKNESERLADCLQSLADLDEVVVLDTGSTDDTIEVAKRHTSKVFRSKIFLPDTPPEDFHFADARNEVLKFCASDWVLSIDADEQLDAEDGALLEFLTDSPEVVHAIGIQSDQGTFLSARILPNNGEVSWHYRCHEVPLPSGDTARMVPYTVAKLVHTRPLDRSVNVKRNLELLRKDMHDYWKQGAPRGPVVKTLADMGRTYLALGYTCEGIGYLRTALDLLASDMSDGVLRRSLLENLASVYRGLDIGPLAFEFASKAWEVVPRSIEAGLVLAECLMSDKCPTGWSRKYNVDEVLDELDECVVPYNGVMSAQREDEFRALVRTYRAKLEARGMDTVGAALAEIEGVC